MAQGRTSKQKLQSILVPSCFLLVMGIIYATTLCPTVYFGDSGELTTAAYLLGIAHPTGYPLYCILGHGAITLFSSTELGISPAFVMNAFSAGCALLTILILYRALLALTEDRWVSVAASAAFGLSTVYWSQAVITEVYTLHTAFAILSIERLIAFSKCARARDGVLSVMALALGLTHHLSIIVLAPAVLAVWIVHRRQWKFKTVALLTLVPVTVVLIYGYLLVRGHAEAAWRPIENLSDLKAHVTASIYQGNLGKGGFDAWREHVFGYLLSLPDRIGWFWFVIAPIGFVVGWSKRSKIVMGLLTLTWIASTAFASAYDVPDSPVFYLLSDMILCIFAALISSLTRFKIPTRALLLSAATLSLLTHFAVCDRSNHRMAEDYAHNVFKTLPRNAVLFAAPMGDLAGVLVYSSIVEKIRPDVSVYVRTQNMLPYLPSEFRSWSRPRIAAMRKEAEREFHSQGHRIYYTHQSGDEPFPLQPYGILFEGTQESRPPPKELWDSYRLQGINGSEMSLDEASTLAAVHVLSMRAMNENARGERALATKSIERAVEISDSVPLALYDLALKFLQWDKNLARSETLLLQALAKKPRFSEAWLALGTVQQLNREDEKAVHSLKNALKGGIRDERRTRYTLIDSLRRLSRFQEALDICDAWLGRFPDDVQMSESRHRLSKELERTPD